MAELKDDVMYFMDKFDLSGMRDIGFPIRYKDADMDVSIDNLDIGNRAYNRLRNFHLDTIGKVIDAWDKLANLQKVGKTTVAEIKFAVVEFFYRRLDEDQIKAFWLRALSPVKESE